jgi:hypothetical protein
MARRYGRCLRCKRLQVGVPHGHWKNNDICRRPDAGGFNAPFDVDGPTNRFGFETYVEKVSSQSCAGAIR